ncbi:MAG: CHAT domain-containing protein [Muribaculaceae bacterium]|nr:CHAT domain-containing protein [Muribaculaceae bacterium]
MKKILFILILLTAACATMRGQTTEQARVLMQQGQELNEKGDLAAAAQAWERALPMVEKYGADYESLLAGLGMLYDAMGDKTNLNRIMVLQNDHNKHELSKPCDEPKCMLERAQYYEYTGDNDHARECYLKALAMPLDDKTTATVHEAYAKFLANMNDYVAATEYARSAANALKRAEGESEAYIQMMYRAAINAGLADDYRQAADCYLACIDFFGRYDSRGARKNLAQCRTGLAMAYMGLEDYEKAKDCYRQVIDYYQATDTSDNRYPMAILNLAKAEKYNKDYDASIEHHRQAIQLMEQRGMNDKLSDAYSSLQLCYASAGRPMPEMDYTAPDQARTATLTRIINDSKANLEITRNHLGQRTYARELAQIAGSYAMLGEYAQAVDYYRQYISAVRDAIRDEFRTQSEAQRMITWQDEAATIHELHELMTQLPVGQDALMEQLAGIVYDAALLSKGILLNSSIEFEKVLAAKGDGKLKDIYRQARDNAERIAQLRQGGNDNLNQILALSRQNETLLQQLYRGCAELADFTDYISHDWHDVQHALGKQDVAIEFVAINTSIFDNENYIVALVITADMAMPTVRLVCSQAIASAMEAHEGLFDLDGNLVWGELTPYLAGKRRIFFSADGAFNRIAIEYLRYDGKPLSEQFDVFRLSSTKELCYKRHNAPVERVTLMGDIDYNESDDPSDRLDSPFLESARGNRGLSDLASTRQELNDIQTVLQQSVGKIDKLTGTMATRNAFLSLNDTRVNVLHIATHGLFNNQQGASDAQSMDNCFLALSGANISDDGFISAAEVARMNLRQCDLAVLSACESALGKLGGDGVFGLQRGFKNAGVHSLLMSLNNVDDASTALLMANFYRLMMSGKCTKRQALVQAQQLLRRQGYTDARHWASFILLDALD